MFALVCLGIAFGVHLPIGDQANMIHFYKVLVMIYKVLVMIGLFLSVIAYGAGGMSIDRDAA